MYRPKIKVVDCTIRDGGLMNDSRFSKEFVRSVYKALASSGVDIIEMGYRNSRKMLSPSKYGIWRFSDDRAIKEAIKGVKTNSKLAVMMDSHKSDTNDIKPKKESPVDLIRVATYVKDIDNAIMTANDAVNKGYEATINVMAVSHAVEWELNEALVQIEKETTVKAVYIVDSFGALYCDDIDYYYDKFKKYIKTKEIGMHCHNHQQLGFGNTIQGIIKGSNYVDATLYGIGRAAGNCPLELLMSFLKNPKFNIRPILEIIETHILPLQKNIVWGYNIPYMIAGILNQHPEESMEYMKIKKNDPKRPSFRNFYEKCVT